LVDASIWEGKTSDKLMMLILDRDESEKTRARLEKARKHLGIDVVKEHE